MCCTLLLFYKETKLDNKIIECDISDGHKCTMHIKVTISKSQKGVKGMIQTKTL